MTITTVLTKRNHCSRIYIYYMSPVTAIFRPRPYHSVRCSEPSFGKFTDLRLIHTELKLQPTDFRLATDSKIGVNRAMLV